MKKYLLGTFALVLAIGLSSFEVFEKKEMRGIVYFTFGPNIEFNSGAESALETADNWTYIGETNPIDCTTGDGLCEIAIDEATLNGASGSNPKQKLENLLKAQTSAYSYVNSLLHVRKLVL